MAIVTLVIAIVLLGLFVFTLFTNKRLEGKVSQLTLEAERQKQYYEVELSRAQGEVRTAMANAQAIVEQKQAELKQEQERAREESDAVLAKAKEQLDQRLAEMTQETTRLRTQYEAASLRERAENRAALAKAQELVDKQLAELTVEADRIRKHYEYAARQAQVAAEALISKMRADYEPLQRYIHLQEPELAARQALNEALSEADVLKKEAKLLVENARAAAANERTQAVQRAKEINQQADALLAQATRDAGRIVSEAERRAEEVAGDAYGALRDKKTLEQAVQALWNVTEGYGDRYVIPTRNLLDELAQDFGHKDAGEALRRAREQSRRMVEEKQAAACNYVEPERRDRANRFVVDAFNGRVDAILSRTRHDNYGTLAQEIRDAFSLVNLNGLAFRDAHILSAYLDARLEELKWGVAAQELRQQERLEQQRIREQMREEEQARREYERAIKESAMEEEMLRKAMEKAQQQVQQATAEQKTKYEQQLQDLAEKLKAAEEKNQRALSMAQQTRRGHVYIISNIGSFGEHVYKIGLTRRLVPQDRIDELGDSSVPFEFDVHALIFSEDAPTLESQLHTHFILNQVNKVNHRKEFFRADLCHIRAEVEKLGLSATWTMAAQASEYRETLAIEKTIRDNPKAREAWINRQLLFEETEETARDDEKLDLTRRDVGSRSSVSKPTLSN